MNDLESQAANLPGAVSDPRDQRERPLLPVIPVHGDDSGEARRASRRIIHLLPADGRPAPASSEAMQEAAARVSSAGTYRSSKSFLTVPDGQARSVPNLRRASTDVASALQLVPNHPSSQREAGDRLADLPNGEQPRRLSFRSDNSSRRGSKQSDFAPRGSAGGRSDHEAGPEGSNKWIAAIVIVKRKAAPRCRALNKNNFFQGAMFSALLSALFLPDMWVVADRPDNKDLDIVLSVVLVMFLFELSVQSIGLSRSYLGSFFFYMDLLGAVSLLLDLSYLPIMSSIGGDSMSGNVVIMRAARIAKLGARAGRFTRLVKLLRFLPGMRDPGANAGTANQISGRLITALSTRVSCLIIIMVMIMPIFSMWSFPELDWSMQAWMENLDRTGLTQPERFARQLSRLGSFYDKLPYYPCRLSAKLADGMPGAVLEQLPWHSPRGPPQRATNLARFESTNLVFEFNFKQPNQIDSLMNLLLLVVVMVLMVGFSLVLSNSVSAIVLRPLENLLLQVRNMAATIFKSVKDMAKTSKQDEGPDEAADDEEDGTATTAAFGETQLLEKVVEKLAILSEISTTKNVVDKDGLKGLGAQDLDLINSFQHSGPVTASWDPDECESDIEEENVNQESILSTQRAMVENAGLSLDLLNSFNLNPLELDKARNHAAAMYFLGPHNHGISFDPVVMAHFLETAELGYPKNVPYHTWFHAIDVTHSVYRLLHICAAESYLNGAERYGVLLSAVCHDIGHPGMNNIFLVETAHELALRYNDKSPLENMHAAKLFELVSAPRCNVFAQLSRTMFQEVRKICIDAILHTDNAQHFSIVKEMQMCYEVNSEVWDASRQSFRRLEGVFPTKEATEVFRQPDLRKLVVNLLLHVADVSNPLKPVRICRIWAWQVLEEFFLQGDAEKRLGIPVQALNDREKVNRAFSQLGFIEFLVSPLLFAVIKVLPPVEPLVEQMVQNAKAWHHQWLSDTKPLPSEAERIAVEERLRRLQGRCLE